MYTTTEQYNIDFNKQTRNQSHMRVKFGIIDVDAKTNSIFTAPNSAPYSAVSVKNELLIPFRYDSLEQNTFILDANFHELAPQTYGDYQGYVSNSLSNVYGYFSSPVTMEITYPALQFYALSGLTFKFDEIRNDFCSIVNVKAYNNLTEVFNSTINPSNYEYVMKQGIPLHNKLVIDYVRTAIPYRRIKVEYLSFGITEIYLDSDLVSTEQTRKVDVISTVQPTAKFQFTFMDLDNEYNPENPTGTYAYIEQRQPVKFEYGYELDDGSIEWILGGTNYSTGKINVENAGGISTVTIDTESSLYYLDSIYKTSVWNDTGRTLFNMATDMLSGSGIAYELDTSLNSIISMTPLPIDTVKNNLQLIANAGLCTLDVNRNGAITIKKSHSVANLYDVSNSLITDNIDSIVLTEEGVTDTDFKFTFENSYNIPTVDKLPSLRNLTSGYTTYTAEASATEIGSSDIVGASSTTFFFNHQLAKTVTLTAGVGLTIVGTVKYYAYGCEVVLTGSGKVTITGKKINSTITSTKLAFGLYGEDCDIVNNLITDILTANSYMSWIGNTLVLSNTYAIENRGYPELDPMDRIFIDTSFTNDLRTILLENNISYNGALRGNSKMIIGA